MILTFITLLSLFTTCFCTTIPEPETMSFSLAKPGETTIEGDMEKLMSIYVGKLPEIRDHREYKQTLKSSTNLMDNLRKKLEEEGVSKDTINAQVSGIYWDFITDLFNLIGYTLKIKNGEVLKWV